MSAKALHKSHTKPNDIIHTPQPIAQIMINMTNIQKENKVLDPSKGPGVFFNNLPDCTKDWCEIADGKDFFENNEQYDVIIGNPPFSLWTKWIKHTLTKCNKFCYIFGSNSLTPNRIKMIHDAGFGITKLHTVKIAWWMSQSFIIVAEKGQPSIMTVTPGTFNCEYCNTHCHRGIYGNPPNECNYEKKQSNKKK